MKKKGQGLSASDMSPGGTVLHASHLAILVSAIAGIINFLATALARLNKRREEIYTPAHVRREEFYMYSNTEKLPFLRIPGIEYMPYTSKSPR
jgi:hypothetical protein